MHARRAALSAALTVLALAPAAGAASSDRCANGGAQAAGRALFGRGTQLAGFAPVAGLRTALVLEPYIAPGTRHRLIRVPGGWCDAETAFNRAWSANGRAVGDGTDMAAAYARLAAAPYFDQTTVTSQRTAGPVHVITTHARTNGVVARWAVITDASGVRTARWAETAYAVKPFVAQWEGLTAVDGASERYLRGAAGLLAAERGLPRPDGTFAPATEVSYTGPDGFKVVIGLGDTRQGVDPGQDTGVFDADILRAARTAVAVNYQDFYSWGFRGAWGPAQTYLGVVGSPVALPAPARTGYVSIDDATSAYCQACVFIADDFQIHLVSGVRKFLEALGYSYGSAGDQDVFDDILGHEMTHDWENNYLKPSSSGRSVPISYSEGIARFQQTLHAYAPIEHQPTTLLYANDVNGCNGFAGSPPSAAFAAGPFETTQYEACNFWLGWYGTEGLAPLVKLISEGILYDTKKTGWTNTTKVIAGLEAATGKPYAQSAAEWAAAIITQQNLAWAPALASGPVTDWSTYLESWNPAALAVGGSATETIANGGLMARRVAGGAFRPSADSGAKLAVVRSDASGTRLSYPANGDLVAGPAAGEDVYVLAIWPSKGSRAVTLSLA